MKKKPSAAGPSDGLEKTEWDAVRALAELIVDASAHGDRRREGTLRRRMRSALARLRRSYGAKPGLLDTLADYTDDPAEQLRLRKAAYRHAVSTGDARNCVLITWSLTSFWMEERPNARAARLWLSRLEQHLRAHRDRHVAADARRMRAALAGQAVQPADRPRNRPRLG